MNRKQTSLKKQLQHILETEPHSLRAAVAREALEYGSDITTFFSDLLAHGCQSGMIGSLIYYHSAHRFYDAHYEEIENLRMEFEEAFGEPLRLKGDLKNWYAWFAFEETARILIGEFLQLQ